MRQRDKAIGWRSSQKLLIRARELRQTATDAEELLWQLLRSRQLDNYKFRRQHPFGTFIADFYCAEAHLIIEIDGAVHLELTQQERDHLREEILCQHHLAILRFTNEEVLCHTENVLGTISSYILTVETKG